MYYSIVGTIQETNGVIANVCKYKGHLSLELVTSWLRQCTYMCACTLCVCMTCKGTIYINVP